VNRAHNPFVGSFAVKNGRITRFSR